MPSASMALNVSESSSSCTNAGGYPATAEAKALAPLVVMLLLLRPSTVSSGREPAAEACASAMRPSSPILLKRRSSSLSRGMKRPKLANTLISASWRCLAPNASRAHCCAPIRAVVTPHLTARLVAAWCWILSVTAAFCSASILRIALQQLAKPTAACGRSGLPASASSINKRSSGASTRLVAPSSSGGNASAAVGAFTSDFIVAYHEAMSCEAAPRVLSPVAVSVAARRARAAAAPLPPIANWMRAALPTRESTVAKGSYLA
mmetsp:Transcript_16905/g.43414  ORF Transcript_16905/g.43414 Transcript_16905/m.43414 type:complete len:263 (-) Transcript_16905:125-913(-)